MKKSLLSLALLALLATAPAIHAANSDGAKPAAEHAARPYTAKTPKLNKAQIDALLAKPDKLLIVDVRRPDEISKIGSFPVYLNVQNDQLEQALPFIPKDRDIVTVSNHAGRAGKAADLLAEKGLHVVGAIGSQNYEEEGGKIVRIVAPAPKEVAQAEHH